MKADEWSPDLASLPQAKPWVKVQPKTLLTEEDVKKFGSFNSPMPQQLVDAYLEGYKKLREDIDSGRTIVTVTVLKK